MVVKMEILCSRVGVNFEVCWFALASFLRLRMSNKNSYAVQQLLVKVRPLASLALPIGTNAIPPLDEESRSRPQVRSPPFPLRT